MDPEIVRQWLPIAISVLSLVLAGVALGWNIYRDVVLKARVDVRFAVVSVVTPGVAQHGSFLNIKVTNRGPGPVTIHGIAGRISPWWRALLRRPQYFVILNDHTNPMNPRLPARLDVADNLNLFLPYDARCVLASNATHIGVTDSFGRELLAPRKDIRVALARFRSDFAGTTVATGGGGRNA